MDKVFQIGFLMGTDLSVNLSEQKPKKMRYSD